MNLRTRTENFFSQLLFLRYIQSVLIPILLILLILLFVFEIISCGLVKFGYLTNILTDNCTQIIDQDVVSEATTFSFSLTAFLLVAVAVVFTIGEQIARDEESSDGEDKGPRDGDYPSGGEKFLVVSSDSNKTEDDYLVIFEFLDTVGLVYSEGGESRGQGGNGPRWGLIGYDGETTFVEQFSSEQWFQFGRGEYLIWRKDELSDEEIAEMSGRMWTTYPRGREGEYFLHNKRGPEVDPPPPDPAPQNGDNGDNGDEGNVSVDRFANKLKKATAYSISASLIGVLILGFSPPPTVIQYSAIPFITNIIDMSSPFTYTIVSYAFATIFLGMVWTSVDLIELMAKNYENE